MVDKEKGRPDRAAANEQANDSTHASLHHNSTAAQRSRILAALRSGPKSTIELRRHWDVLSPAPRIKELRDREGHSILTNWVQHATECGKLHRVALYVLHDSDHATAAAGAPKTRHGPRFQLLGTPGIAPAAQRHLGPLLPQPEAVMEATYGPKP